MYFVNVLIIYLAQIKSEFILYESNIRLHLKQILNPLKFLFVYRADTHRISQAHTYGVWDDRENDLKFFPHKQGNHKLHFSWFCNKKVKTEFYFLRWFRWWFDINLYILYEMSSNCEKVVKNSNKIIKFCSWNFKKYT